MFLAFALVALGSGAVGHAADWSRFRGPNGSAVSDARGVPTDWSDSTKLAWKTALPGPGSSSPIVVGDRVFLTCYSGYGTSRGAAGDVKKLQRHLICVSLKDGKILWDKAVASKQSEDRFDGFIQDHGYATSTPVSDGEQVFVFFGKSGVLAFDLDGKELWQTSVGTGSGMNGWGSGSSPILYRNNVIVNAASRANRSSPWRQRLARKHGERMRTASTGPGRHQYWSMSPIRNAVVEIWQCDNGGAYLHSKAAGLKCSTGYCGRIVRLHLGKVSERWM